MTATVDGQMVKVKGTKGELSFVVPEEVSVALADGAVAVNPRDESKTARAKWGMSRAQVANLVEGVSKGFEKRLEINGVGYKAAVAGKVLKLSLGYSHDIDYAIPAGVTITTPRPTGWSLLASTSRSSVRPPPRSANIAVRSPIRARA